MPKLNPSDPKKILIVIFILVLLLAAIVILRNRSIFQAGSINKSENQANISPKAEASVTKEPLVGEYMFNKRSFETKLSESGNIIIEFKAPGKRLFGADVYLVYDPTFLEIQKVSPAGYFQDYPRKDVDAKKGEIKISAFRPREDKILKENVPYATITYKGLKTGSTKIKFDFSQGRSDKSTLVEFKTSKNILGKVNDAEIVINK